MAGTLGLIPRGPTGIQMFSAFDSRSSGLDFSSGRGHRVVFLGRKFYTPCARNVNNRQMVEKITTYCKNLTFLDISS